MKYPIIIFACSMILCAGCKVPKEPDPQETTPNKEAITYTLTKLAKDHTYKIPSNELRAVISSGDGEFIYIVPKNKPGLRVLEVDKGLWHDALEWSKVQKARDRSEVNLANDIISGFDTFEKGILFTLKNNRGFVILKGYGISNASYYEQNPASNFKAEAFTPFFVTKKDNSHFVYLFPHQSVAKNRVLFRTYAEPPKADNALNPVWDRSLGKSAGVPLDTILLARTQDNEKNLLIADKDGIKRVMEPDLGVTGKVLDNAGKPIYEPAAFMLDGKTQNSHINTIKLIDDKILVVGLKSTESNNGGIALADLSEKTPKWRHFGKGLGLSVDVIAPERFRQRDKTKIAAIITTDKGLLFMDNEGTMMEPSKKGQGHLVTINVINNQRAEITKYDDVRDGFLGDRVPLTADYLSAAQDKNGAWYLGFRGDSADDGGIYKLDIRIEQIAPPVTPPVLPY